MQIYCEELGKYLDLGNDTTFSFNLQNQWQHFFEEPQNFSFSTDLPMTANNLEILYPKDSEDYHLSIIVDDYKIMKNFRAQVLGRNLSNIKISLYRYGVLPKMSVPYETGVNWEQYRKNVNYNYKVCCYGTEATASKKEHKPNCTIFTCRDHQDVYYWKNNTDGDWLNGDGELKTVKPAYYEWSIFRIPFTDLLEVLLGYLPDEYKDDTDYYVDIPFCWNNFKICGKLEINFMGGDLRDKFQNMYYYPKYCSNANRTTFDTNHYYAHSAWGDSPWNKSYFHYMPCEWKRDELKYSQSSDAHYPIHITNTAEPIFAFSDVAKDGEFHGIWRANTLTNFSLYKDIDDSWDLTQDKFNKTYMMPSMILNLWYEDLAKQILLLCDYDKGLDTLFRQATWTPKESIIDWEETTKIKDDIKYKDFKMSFGELTPYFWNNLSSADFELEELTMSDMGVTFITKDDTQTGGTTYETFQPSVSVLYNDANKEYDAHISKVKWNNTKKKWLAEGSNAYLFIKNYQQNVMTEVKMTCTNYKFQSDIVVGSRAFVVDEVTTDDFKVFEIKMLEYPVEQ